jgi:hypothetical protein
MISSKISSITLIFVKQIPNAVVKSDFVIKRILFQSIAKLVGILEIVLYVLVQLLQLRVLGRASDTLAIFAELVLIVAKSKKVKALSILAATLYIHLLPYQNLL